MEKKLTELYGSYTFNDDVMKERLPKETYKAFHDALDKGETMSKDVATIIAEEMKNWAIEKGATHFTHWFSPLTGLSAEKHDDEYSLEGLMLKLKLQYCGHLMGRTDSLGKTLMLGKNEDGRRRGRQRMRWLDGITD